MSSSRISRVVTVSLPPALAAEFDRLAEAEGRNRSELFREMFRSYLVQRELSELDALQRYGAERAADLGVLSEDDVVRIVAEERSSYR
jgi:metal-responsive CopG/Arc/MetJ family transcriptional regulator